jgi:multicomponent K+:H+ antiporter subunit E
MKRRYGLPAPLLSLVLLLTWLLLVNSLTPAQVALGALLGWSLPLVLRRFRLHDTRIRRPLRLLRLLLVVLKDIVRANLQVIPLILGPNARLRPGFIEFPVQLPHDFAVSVLASMVSLAPGTVSVDLSADRRTLLIHVLHLEDADAMIAWIKHEYETPLREILAC